MAVTGQLGGEEIRLDNAATEATLKDLVAAVNKMSTSSGKDGGGKKVKTLHEKLTESSDNVEDFGDATANAGEDVAEFGSKVGGAAKAVGGFFFNSLKNLTVGAVSFAADLATSGNRLTDVAETLPLIGSYLTPLTNIIDANIDAYREMSASGASFGNSMLEMRLAATTAGLGLEQFKSMITENSETLAVFGSNVSDGARRFSNLSRGIREGELGQRLMGMGFTIEDVNSGLSSYLELQARQGRLEQMSNQELREGAGEYLTQLDALTKVTGMQRKEAEEAMLAQQEESKMRVMRATATNKEAFDANMALLDQLGAAGGAFKDLSDGVAQTDIGQKLQAIAPGATELAQQMATGSIGAEEARNRLAELGPQIEKFAREVGPAALESFGGSMSGLLSLLDENYKLQRLNNDAVEGMTEAEQNRRNTITEALGGFEQTLSSIKSRFMAAFLESGFFQDITGQLENFLDWLNVTNTSGKSRMDGVIDGLTDALKPVSAWFESFIADIKEFGIKETLSKLFSDITDSIKSMVFGGITGKQEERRSSLQSQKAQLEQSTPTSEVGEQLRQDKLAAVNEELASIQEKADSGGILGAIIPEFDALSAVLTGGAIIGGLLALRKAFAAFAAPQVAMGVGVIAGFLIGTGAAIMLAGKGIDLAGDGIEKVADGMQRMSELKDVSKLQDIGASLGMLGTGLLDLAKGSVLDSITQFFGADSPFDKIIAGVNKFANVDNAAFANLLHTSTSLKQLADVDFESDNLGNYTENIRKLSFAVGNIDPNTLDSLKQFATADFSQGASNLSRMSEIQFDSSGIESYKDAIEDLTAALQGLNTELAEDNNSGLFGQNENLSAGQLMQQTGQNSQSGGNDKLEQVNRVLQDILSVLMQSNDMNNRQLRATRSMVGNLY